MRNLLFVLSFLIIAFTSSAQKGNWTAGLTGDLKTNNISPVSYGGFSAGLFADYQLTNRLHFNAALKYNYLFYDVSNFVECGVGLDDEIREFIATSNYEQTNIIQLPVNFLINIIQSKNQYFKLFLSGGAGPAYVLDNSRVYKGAEDKFRKTYDQGFTFVTHGGIEARFKFQDKYYIGLGAEATTFIDNKTTEAPFAATIKIGKALN